MGERGEIGETKITNQMNYPPTIVKGILENSLQVGGNLPLQITKNNFLRNLIVVDDVLNSPFLDLSAPAIAIPQQLGYQRQIVDRHTLEMVTKDESKTLLQLFIRGNPFRGSAGLTKDAIAQYQQLIKSDRLIALIIYGSPYVLNWFRSNIQQDIPWVFTYGQMDLAQAIALKTLFALKREDDSLVSIAISAIKDNVTNNFGF